MWYSRIWTIMYVDLSGPNPTCGPLIVAKINGSDGFTTKSCSWKQRVLYQKKKRSVPWCEPSRVHGAADTCECVCVTHSVVRENQKGQGQGRERGWLMQWSREWCTLSLLFMLVKAFEYSRWPLAKGAQNPFVLIEIGLSTSFGPGLASKWTSGVV